MSILRSAISGSVLAISSIYDILFPLRLTVKTSYRYEVWRKDLCGSDLISDVPTFGRRRCRKWAILTFLLFSSVGCDRIEHKGHSQSRTRISQGLSPDKIYNEEVAFRYETRMLYNSRKFNELEKRANDLRTTKAKFGNGTWKLVEFYDSLGCRDDEPESMWRLHEQIHQDWEKAMPHSVTARIAHADFLYDYAFHARGYGFANTVTREGWRLFGQRLTQAKNILDDVRHWEPQCPMWWKVYMAVAAGQGWSRSDYENLFTEAKAFEPQWWSYDVARAHYLLPRWYGRPGDWEYVTDEETKRAGGLGMEVYARVVSVFRSYYKNIFQESSASWPKTREGFELMRKRYPESLEILSAYCQLACIAGDRPQAKKLFGELGDSVMQYIWGSKDNFLKYRAWADGAPSPSDTVQETQDSRFVTLTADAEISRPAGKTKLRKGSRFPLTTVSGTNITIHYFDGRDYSVPASSTDLAK